MDTGLLLDDFVDEAMSTRELDLLIPASAMKVLFSHKSLYEVFLCVCECVR